jgi:hypothetical protein
VALFGVVIINPTSLNLNHDRTHKLLTHQFVFALSTFARRRLQQLITPRAFSKPRYLSPVYGT